MTDYGQELIDSGLGELEGEWEYQGETHKLRVEEISYPDFRLMRQYVAVAQQVNEIDNPDEINDDDVDRLESQVEKLDQFSWEGDDNRDFMESAIDNKLVKPEVTVSNTAPDITQALFFGMFKAWAKSQSVEDAEDEMPVKQGNP